MTQCLAVVERLVSAYNHKDFNTLEALLAPNLDFAHFNRGFEFNDRGKVLEIIRHFAAELVPDRRMEEAVRVTVSGNIVVREAYYSGTAATDIPGFATAGHFRLKFCSVFQLDDAGVILEWKDYG